MKRMLSRSSPELILVTAAVISAVNVLVVLDVVRLASAHLGTVNIGLAGVLALLARGLVQARQAEDPAAGRRP